VSDLRSQMPFAGLERIREETIEAALERWGTETR
jgi:hypothetical protein